MIRIMLVDDHTMMREALCLVLQQSSEVEVVAEAGDGETALRLAAALLPDVVVMDVSMAGLSGIETTQRLVNMHPQIKVLGLSTHLDQNIIRQMLQVGASGYISKSAVGGELLQGIQSAFAGHSYLSAEVAALLADSLRDSGNALMKPGSGRLSRREQQIAALLAQGSTAAEIAGVLHISLGTVDVHRRNLMRKLDLHSVVELTRYALRTGLTSL